MAMELNEDQMCALQLELAGHNFILTGWAGTGKSFTVSTIVRHLRSLDKEVALTCATGISCLVYPTLQATTIHTFCGIEDGRRVRDVIKHSTKHQIVVKALQQTDVLIIDECSMVSSRTLSLVSDVLSIKDSTLHFGGIQAILLGDFYQLPPVKDTKYSDSGQYCFENKVIHQFPHRVILTKVERQSDPTLISACTEVAEGNISADTAKYIYSLDSTNIDPKYKLFATNDLVDDHNRMNIFQHKGELVEYISEFARLTVPKVLWLKVGVPVILLRNLSSQLVNGLQGIVTYIGPEGPVVLFAGPNVTMTLKKSNFQVFSPKLGVNVASREQYPIKPAFGITIHKAQGMTLDRDVLDASSKVTVKDILSLPMDVDVQPSDEDFDEDFNQALLAMDSEVQDCVNFELPDEFKCDKTLKSLDVSQPVSPSQVHNNRIIDSMSTVKTEMFLKKELHSLIS